LPVPTGKGPDDEVAPTREVEPEMETKLKILYRKLALKYHPDKNPDDPAASDRFQALTRAYRALVGDTAGPEEGDDEAVDPFVVAHHNSFRPKFRHRWQTEELEKEARRREQRSAPALPQAAETSPEEKAAAAAALAVERGERGPFDEDAGDKNGHAEKVEYEEWDSEEAFEVKLEIDESFAASEPIWEPQAQTDQQPSAQSQWVEESSESDLTINEEADVPTKTLPPPDVIIVSQPRSRKAGVGTPTYFHSWLRSTAARTIVYVATDVDALHKDLKALMNLGYRTERVQPFDAEPHRRGVVLVARLVLIQPLVGSAEYPDREERLLGERGLFLPQEPHRFPMLGAGGYSAPRA